MKVKKNWCPLEGTPYLGYCIENHAVIKIKGYVCDHKDYCERLKVTLDFYRSTKNTRNEHESRNLH